MKKARIFGAAIALFAALAIPAGTVRAQEAAAAAAAASAITAPIIRVVHAVLPKTTPAGDSWLKAEVIHFNSRSIIVREAGNERMIHTFTYTSALQPKMQTLMDKGGYQYGDRVKILYQPGPGQLVALEIHGKRSKAQ
ncbi:MAG: hypothetical protein WBQ34_11765 [Candidatus Acidiferrales bacterium]